MNQTSGSDPKDTTQQFHPAITCDEIWPGPTGYTRGATPLTREALLRPVSGNVLPCCWTTGGFTEPAPGNFTMIARSEDNGKRWSHVGKFQHPVRGLFTTELFVPDESKNEVHAFLNTYDFGSWMCQLHSYRAISHDGGLTWSGPHSIGAGVDNVWPNKGIVLSSGRWIIPVSWSELNGDEWAQPSNGRSPADGLVGNRNLVQTELPYGVDSHSQYQAGNAWADRNHRYACGVLLSDDGGKTFRLRGYLRGGAHGHLMEPRVVETSDGRIKMLIRSQRDGYLWQSESADGGESWEDATRSEIPNPAAKVWLSRHSDGRIFLVHNPVGHDGAVMGGRNPLSLWISEDDMKSWSVKIDLIRDSRADATLNYPDGFVDEDNNQLVFVWEDMHSVFLTQVPLDISQ